VAAQKIIDIPYLPREAFDPLHERWQRWAAVVAHRRAGKTVACVNELIRGAFTCALPRPCFAYVAPRLVQAKDIAWNYLLDFTQCFAEAGLRKVNQSELWVEIGPNRGRIRLYGADERLRGGYFDGVVLDEYGDFPPGIWSQVIRPMLNDREGWAIFIGTPKGRNGFHRLWTAAEGDPDWYRLALKAGETKLLSQKELADARKAMTDDEYAQEYECSFDAAVRGAYWGKEIARLEEEGRIGEVPFDPALQVHTAWDLGMADSTVIWFLQEHRSSGEIRVIDVLKGEGAPLRWYAKEIQDRPLLHGSGEGWVWGNHYLPHDAEVRELTSGASRVEALAELGIQATICGRLPVEDGIQAVRSLLPRCWFDKERCAAGIEALRMYRREYDERRQEYRVRPLHDWTSHYADALRYFAMEHKPRAAAHGAATYGSTRRMGARRDLRWVV
jgi:hypothetical protein